MTMLVRYWGVRGSIPVPGAGTARYGGNTSCLEVRTPACRVVVDGGTGLRALGATFTQPEEFVMLFTHLHWDHIQGFPFFAPIYRKGFAIHIYSGHKADVSLEAVLRGQMQEPNFPVDLGHLPAHFTFNEIPKGSPLQLDGLAVQTIKLNHPNEAMGLKFEAGAKRFVHLTDHEHLPDWNDRIVAFCKGADVLSMDTFFTPEAYPKHVGWGHSSWEHAASICAEAGVRQLVLFHHAPEHDDAMMDRILLAARQKLPNTIAAYEGLELSL
jgi:phosphoribosyl 1,2-cyclic phosphodiesterase